MRKRRTRNHIIADLSVNHVERTRHDYGIDLMLFTYTDDGEYENESINIQLKATDNLPVLKDGQTISFPSRSRAGSPARGLEYPQRIVGQSCPPLPALPD